MNLVLDTGILGQLCHPHQKQSQPIVDWLAELLGGTEAGRVKVCLPEICDYELRRKLLHLTSKGMASPLGIERLNRLCAELEFLSLDTPVMRRAAELWAESRRRGRPTADDTALDADVILAAQAESVEGVVVTTNPKHLAQFVKTADWREIAPRASDS